MYRCVFPHSEVEYDNLFFNDIDEVKNYALNQLEDSAAILNSNGTVVYIMYDFEWYTIH